MANDKKMIEEQALIIEQLKEREKVLQQSVNNWELEAEAAKKNAEDERKNLKKILAEKEQAQQDLESVKSKVDKANEDFDVALAKVQEANTALSNSLEEKKNVDAQSHITLNNAADAITVAHAQAKGIVEEANKQALAINLKTKNTADGLAVLEAKVLQLSDGIENLKQIGKTLEDDIAKSQDVLENIKAVTADANSNLERLQSEITSKTIALQKLNDSIKEAETAKKVAEKELTQIASKQKAADSALSATLKKTTNLLDREEGVQQKEETLRDKYQRLGLNYDD